MKYQFPSFVVTPPKSGIYGILHRESGKIYIGSALKMAKRWREHRHGLNLKNHRSPYLQNAFNKSPGAFEFFVIESVENPTGLLAREQFWIDFYKSFIPDYGYNIAITAGSSLGIKRSRESRARKSLMHTGRPQPWLRKPVVQMDLNGADIKTFASLFDASRAMGFSKPNGNIVSAAKGNQHTAYGFKWRYA